MSFSRSVTEIIKRCQNKNLIQMATNPLNEKHSKITDGKKMASLDCAVILIKRR